MDPLKKKYFLYHLLLSLTIVSTASIICVVFLFPRPFLSLDRTSHALTILATIDVVLGPLLTLILVNSKKSKRELLLDFAFILTIQISAFLYGAISIINERPSAIIYFKGAFHLVPAKKVTSKSMPPIKSFKGVRIGFIESKTSERHYSSSVEDIIYIPKYYSNLNSEILEDESLRFETLPLKVKNDYPSDSYIFKVLVGKKRTAVVIIDMEYDVRDIVLLDKHT